MTPAARPPVVVDDALAARLAAVLALGPAAAEQVRDATPARRRPRPQTGPTADYGSDDGTTAAPAESAEDGPTVHGRP